jgi:hypothetical protein
MWQKLTVLACFGMLSTIVRAQTTTLISTTEISRMEIHRGGADAPATGPTEDGYVTWYASFGQVERKYMTTTYVPNGYHGGSTTSYSYSTVLSDEPLNNMCTDCGANAGYELKIYSSQDPRIERLNKPIVIVPGFDPEFGGSDPSNTFQNFAGMMSSVYDETQYEKVLVPGKNFLRELYDAGYDIVFIKFYNPNIDIAVNAKVLAQAMLWLNSKSSTRAGDEPAILGASMGGLIARRMLEDAGKSQGPSGGPIKARLFISFDAPNRGAVIPVSVQAMVRYLRDDNGSAEVFNSNIGSVGAGQMLMIQRYNSVNSDASHSITDYEASGSTHGDFIKDLNSAANLLAIKNVKAINNLRSIRTVGISNGSHNGADALRGLPAGTNYASEDYLTLYYRLAFSNENSATSVFTGDKAGWYNTWKYFLLEPVFLENLPGGNRNSYKQLMGTLARGGYGTLSWTVQYPGHCFIPTASGLGLTDINVNAPGAWLNTTGVSMFDETHSPVFNQDHMEITMENKEWIYDSLRHFGPGSINIVGPILSPLPL